MAKIETSTGTVEIEDEAVENIRKVAESNLASSDLAQKVIEAVEDG